MRCFALILGICILCQLSAVAQTYRKGEINIENFVEELFPMQQGEDIYEAMYESLLQFFLNPLDLNKANAEDLKSLYILHPNQVNHFLAYRETLGPFVSIYELQAIPEFDLETIYKLLPFVVLDEKGRSRKGFFDHIQEANDAYLIVRQRRVWEERRGFTVPDTSSTGRISSRYLGDPNQLYARFRLQQSRDFSFGFTMDKDAGEQFIWDPNTRRYGFNFFSFHASLYNRGRLKALQIGDFQMQSGQGLVFGAGFTVGKGAETITAVRRSTVGLRPYTAAMESGFFRGISATYQFGRVHATVMASRLRRDGTREVLIDTLENEIEILTALQTSGLHRTPTEISRKGQALEQNLGANIHYQSRRRDLQLGANTLFTSFSQSFQRTPRNYNQFEFSGRSNQVHSLYFAYNYQNFFFFGESAISQSGGQASLLGMMGSLHPKVSVSMLWRNYDRDFHSFYGNAFAENTRPINEKGIYFGLNYKPNRKTAWAFYYDHFKFPWLRFRAYAPSDGHEWLGRFSYTPTRKILLFVQYREESKARNISNYPDSQSSYLLDQFLRRNFVFNLDYGIDRHWSIKSRVMGSSFAHDGQKTRGFAISQDLNYDRQQWRISSRLVLFDTDDFDNRQFIYERNVLWLFSIPALHGQGMRYYVLGQYKLGRKLSLWARFSRTIFTDRDRIGSGLQEIQGNRITETVFQLQYKFNK